MPKPIPVAIRRQIVEARQGGEKLSQIARELGMPYESVRNVWRLYRKAGRIHPNFQASGRKGARCARKVYFAAVFLKALHPSWGAGLIRQVILQRWPDAQVPSPRSLQRWFASKRRKGRALVQVEARIGRGKTPHNIWEMDSREGIRLKNGERAIWLLVSDEASGAILSSEVFPPKSSEPIDRRDCAEAFTRDFCALGLAESLAN